MAAKKKGQTKLQEDGPDYQNFFRNCQEPFFIITKKGEWIDFSDALVRLFGYPSREEFSRVKIASLHAKPPERKNLFSQADRAGQVTDCPARMKRKDGTLFSASISVTAGRDAAGTVVTYSGAIHDMAGVTPSGRMPPATKEGAATLTEIGAEFFPLFEAMDEGVVIHEVLYTEDGTPSDYRIMDVNPAFTRNTGIPPEKARGELASRVYGSGEAPFLERYAAVAGSGKPDSFEIYFAPLQRYFRISVVSPRKGWFATVFHNITGQKQKEAELAAEHKKTEEQFILFSSLMNSVVSNIHSVDRQFRYTSFNRSHAATMKDLYGIDIRPGMNFIDCITIEKDQKLIHDALRRTVGGETVVLEEYLGNNAISRQFRDCSFNPIRDTAGEVIGVAVISRDSTARKQAEKALRASEERYRRLTENSQDIIFRIALPDRRFDYISPAVHPLTGYLPDDFYKNPHLMHEMIHPDFRERLRILWERLPKGDLLREYEYQILHKNGEARWFHQRNTIVRNRTGHVVALEGIVTDITGRKMAEIALHQIEERYRLISENTGDVIWILSLDTMRFTFVSPSAYRLLGYTCEEAQNLTLARILTPESLSYVGEILPKTLAAINAGDESARIQTHRINQVRKDGTVIAVEIVATFVTGAGRDEIIGVSRDISERKKAQDALQESEEKFRSLVETTSDLVWEIGADGHYTYVSPRVRDILGYEPEEVTGKSPFDIMPPYEADVMRKEFSRYSGSCQPVPAIVNRCLHKNGSVVIMETSAVPRFDHEGNYAGYRGIDRDITLRKLAQDALIESEDRYRTFIECSNEAIFVIQDGHIPFCNKKGMELIGYDRDFLRQHDFLEFVHPDDRTGATMRHLRRLKGESINPLAELRVYDAGGALHWIEINAVLVTWDGRPASLNFATDITERKNATDALRESERGYHLLADNVTDVIWTADRDMNLTYISPSITALTGHTPAEFIRLCPEECLTSESLALLLRSRGEVIAQLAPGCRVAPRPQVLELEYRKKDGTLVWAEVVISLIHTGDDDPQGVIGVTRDITDRKRAEEAIKESEERFRTLLERVQSVAVQGYRPDHTVVYWNEANTRIYGYTAEEAIGKDLRDLIVPPPAREEVTAAIARMADTGIPEPAAEIMLSHKNGSLVPVFSSHAVVKIPGKSTILFCIDVDLTERRRAEEALRNSETYLRTIINSVQTGLIIIDPENHTIVDVNPAAERLAGVPRDRMIGSVCHRFICPAEEGNCPVTDHNNTVDNSERTLITANGPRSILKTVVPAIISGKKLLLESFIDITDRKKAEEKLTESEEKFHLIFRNSNDAIYLFEITSSGMPGRIVDANQVALLHTGETQEHLLKKTFLEIHTHELPQKSRSIMMELLTKGQVRFETEVARKDGPKLPVEVSAQFARLNQKTYVIAISRDVSRRKREERALRIANQKLQLMNIVAWHDIQNKVTGLRGYVELSKDLVTDEQMKRFIQSEEEVLKVIHQQLQYTKEYQEMGVHPQEWVNLSQTLRMILSLAELGSIQVIIDVSDLEIFCDPVIAKVFSHLLDNTKIHGTKASRIQISCHETGDGLTLVYEDDGIGIPEEQKKELFMRNVGASTGFSLFFIHDLLEVSEMTIRETGIPGEGVRFEIGIPRGIYRFGNKLP